MNAKATIAVRNASPYPHNERTRKGNYAEVFLAEYLNGATSSSLPVYRLRYNPNPEQAMKGDDVLLFDLDSDPIRIIVGEAKFREVPNKQAVVDMIDALMRSHRAGLPASVVFVAQRLITEGNIDLGTKVMSCLSLFAAAKLRIDYVGLLMSNTNARANINRNSQTQLHNLLLMSLGIDNPSSVVKDAFDKLENDL